MDNTGQYKEHGFLIKLLHVIEDSFLVILLSSMIGLAVTQIVMRNLFDSGISWADPLLRLLVLWVGLAGAMVATRQDHHITIDVVTRMLPRRLQLSVRVFADIFSCFITALIAYHAGRFVLMDKQAETIAFAQIPAWWCELIVPMAFAVIALRYMVFAALHVWELLTGQEF